MLLDLRGVSCVGDRDLFLLDGVIEAVHCLVVPSCVVMNDAQKVPAQSQNAAQPGAIGLRLDEFFKDGDRLLTRLKSLGLLVNSVLYLADFSVTHAEFLLEFGHRWVLLGQGHAVGECPFECRQGLFDLPLFLVDTADVDCLIASRLSSHSGFGP